MIAVALKRELLDFPDFGKDDNDLLQRFADVCANVSAQIDELPGFGSLNYPDAICGLLEKLPSFIADKWSSRVYKYLEEHNETYPGFSYFSAFVNELSDIRNNPALLRTKPSSSAAIRRPIGAVGASNGPPPEVGPPKSSRQMLPPTMRLFQTIVAFSTLAVPTILAIAEPSARFLLTNAWT